jgi:hypothetical protein
MKEETVLLLGGTSLIGCEIAVGILGHTDAHVIVSGRNEAAVGKLSAELAGLRRSFITLDAHDAAGLVRACRDAGLVINCVGPYDLAGAEIAETALRAGASYIDFAYEQIHYRKCQALDGLARQMGLFMVVGAGMISGSTTLFIEDALGKIPGIKEIEVFYVEGPWHDEKSGFGSIISGSLEAASPRESLRGSRLEPFKIGSATRRDSASGETGVMDGLQIPTVDDIHFASRWNGPESIKTYLAMDVRTPEIIFSLIRVLRPDRNPAMYRLFCGVARNMIKTGYARQRKQGISRKPTMKMTARTATKEYTRTVRFSDERNATSFLPILLARKWRSHGIEAKGLLNVTDVMDLPCVLGELKTIGRTLDAGEWRPGIRS